MSDRVNLASGLAAIRTVGLSRSFGGVLALDSLDLEVGAGRVFGFLGPNGAGKTTAIRLMMGLIEPTRGHAMVLGLDVGEHGDEVRRRSGTLIADAGHYDRLSARDNLEFFGRAFGLSPRERARRVAELLGRFRIADTGSRPVGNFSRGMRQKLALSRALLNDPELIFLDEPMTGLDPEAMVELRGLISEQAEDRGVTTFITSHNLKEVAEICDDLAILKAGRVVASGTPDEIRRLAGPVRLLVHSTGGDAGLSARLAAMDGVLAVDRPHNGWCIELGEQEFAAPLVSLLVESGAEVEQVIRVTPSLESSYLALTGGGHDA